ncbi:phage tail tape measure protein [uncultured Bacteroides sp.]|uniref:phage tail tape measure protein n=1 Tax=uncultured Bacteroides sp. TaxID=162156 RepID=UPI002588841C|nr:phage tail tape measure protein [uncultured Bacteroides sp.]
MAKNNKTVKRGVYLYIDGKEIKNDINSIDLEMKRLQRDIKEMTRGSEEYNRTMAKIQHLQGILKQHRQEIKGITTETKKATVSIGSMVDWFNRFGGVILSVIGFLTGVTLALRTIRDERNKLEESQAGLKALTGLDDDNIAWLTEQAKTLSTTMTKEGLRVRQSAAEILDAFMLVGSAKPELLGDKEALKAVTEEAMRLQAAAKDITLNEAVDSLTLSLNQYGEAADQAGRFSNVLAAGSQAGSANIASQAKAIRNAGTAAASANVPIEQTVALIETLAYRGIKDEVAGTGLKRFFLKLQTGADETNPKIVGLDKALENLKNKNMDAGTIKNMFGEEGFNAASVILQNTEMVKDFTAAVTGTNVAYEQAAINSDTAQAKLEQARNKMKLAAIDLGEKLNPALAVSTNMLSYVIKILPGLIDWIQKWGGTVVTLLVPLATYYATLRLIALHHTSYNKVMRAGIIVKTAYRMATIALNDALAGDYKAITRLILQMRSHNIITRTVAAGTLVLRAGVEALTLRFSAATKAIRAAWAVLGLNPIATIATAIAAVAIASYKLTQRTKAYYDLNKVNEKITEKSNNEYKRQSSLIDQLTSKIHNNNLSNSERKKAIEELQAIIPDYNAEIDKEGKIINENTEALDRYNAVLATNIELKEVADELDKHRINLMRLQKSPALSDNSPMGSMAREDVRNKISQEEEIVASLTDRYKKLVQEKWKALNLKTVTPEPLSPVTNGSNGGTESEEERKKRVSKELEDLETKHMQQMTHLQKLYLEGEIKTNEEYTALQIDLEKKTLDEKLKIVGLEPHEREKLQVKMLEAQIKFNEECKKLDEKAEKERQKAADKTAKERLSIRQKQLRIELEEATANHYKNLTSEEEFAKEVNDIRQRYWQDLLDNYQLTEEQRTEIDKEQAEAKTDAEKEKYEKTMEMHKQYASMVESIAADFGETIGEMIATGELSLKDFLKETILMALDALERVIEISCLEVMVKNLAATAPLSFIGAAKAALQIAAIKASFAVVKGIVGNFYTGGYTGPGNWDQPQGIVHSNEFVANRFAVANPNLRPIFDVIDVAQRTGNVGNLTAEDIAAVAGSGKSTRTVPAKAPGASATTTTNDPAMVAMLVECTRVLRKLKNRLDDPLVAETYVTGKRGINQAQREYKKLENNKSRNKQ